MPELPEVETIVRDVRPLIVGRTVTGVTFDWPGSIGQPEPAEFVQQIIGRTIDSVGRRGKNILIGLAGDLTLQIHLRMSGRLVVAEQGEERYRFQRVALLLDDGQELRLADLRKFARMRLIPSGELETLHQGLGPEPLSDNFSSADFHKMLQKRNTRLKSLLLDQKFVAGIGNIYADEALFVSGIHPHRVASSLTDEESKRLLWALKAVLTKAIGDRGTTFSDYRDGRGEPGLHQQELWVYRRTNEACRQCGTAIVRLRFGGRGTHFCPACQHAG